LKKMSSKEFIKVLVLLMKWKDLRKSLM
jgi:hypothetical protein